MDSAEAHAEGMNVPVNEGSDVLQRGRREPWGGGGSTMTFRKKHKV